MLGLFTKERKPEPEIPWALRRRDELLAVLENLDTALDDIGEKLADFRFQHCAFDGKRLVYVSESPLNCVQLEQMERDLLTRRDQILRERNTVLQEWANLPAEVRNG